MRYHDASDAHLVQAVRDGDRDAFGELFLRYLPDVDRICRGRLRDHHLVDDAVQATFVRVLERIATFEGDAKIGHFIFATAKYQCMDRSAARRRHAEQLSAMDVEEQVAADPSAWRDDESLDEINVDEILGALAADQASMLVEHHIHGHSLSELAQRRGATPKSISVRIHRARRKAAEYADARGMWGLAPIPLFPRFIAWLRRHGVAAQPLAAGAMVAAALSAVIAAPATASRDAWIATSAPVVAADIAEQVVSQLSADSSSATARRGRMPLKAEAGDAAQEGEDDGVPDHRDTLVPVSEIIVPETGAGWTQEHPDDPDHVVTTQVNGEHLMTIAVDDVEQADRVLRGGCDASTSATTEVVSCADDA
jgi:RNA polymerase sigma-70 factor (ECF subfamily)